MPRLIVFKAILRRTGFFLFIQAEDTHTAATDRLALGHEQRSYRVDHARAGDRSSRASMA